MDYTALTMTVLRLQEAIDYAVKIDKDKRLVDDEAWIWNMLTLAKVKEFFDEELHDFDTFNSIFNDRADNI